jgi:hypothetical protein
LVDFTEEGIEVTETTNEELLQATKEAASLLSFYNAAEGDNWERERTARSVAHAKFYNLKEICMERGIYNPEDFKHFLV